MRTPIVSVQIILVVVALANGGVRIEQTAIVGQAIGIETNRVLTFGSTRAIGREGDPVRCVITDLDPATQLIGPSIMPANIAAVSSPLASVLIAVPNGFRSGAPDRDAYLSGRHPAMGGR